MSFLFPLGLIGLVGIPILILIYILKNKYTEQIISSTYIWNLSEKFLKSKKPISMVSGIISLILQIMIVIAVSFAIAQPRLVLKGQAKDYCFILDGSASMNRVQAGVTRLDIGKSRVKSLIEESKDGSTYTLIHMGDTTRIVYQQLDNKEQALELLDSSVLPAYLAPTMVDSMSYAQDYYSQNKSMQTYLVTDKNYSTSNIELINVAEETKNFAILDAMYEQIASLVRIDGKIISYTSDENLELEVSINSKSMSKQVIACEKGKETDFHFTLSVEELQSIELKILNEDGLKEDNVKILYSSVFNHSYRTLLVSDAPTYLNSAISVWKKTSLDVISSKDYKSSMRGYDLYIFDSVKLEELPDDGAVWLINIDDNLPQSGFILQDSIEVEDGVSLTIPTSTNSLFKSLTQNLTGQNVMVQSYLKYGQSRSFTNILMFDENPMVFAGTNSYGNREVVFSFDLHTSNISMLSDYIYLVENLLNYSFPTILEKTSYVCGDTLTVNVLGHCRKILVQSPSGKKSYMDTSNITSEYYLTEAGTYQLIMTLGEEEKSFFVYASMPNTEGVDLDASEENLSLEGEREENYQDGYYENLMIIFIVLAVIYLADWAVYCYEQHQL